VPTLILQIEPPQARTAATVQIDGSPLVGARLELPAPRRVHVSVTAVGFFRFSQDVEVDRDVVLPIELARRPHEKNRTLAVTLGMAALGVLAYLLRRR
jgi:hypothetical protein